MMCMEGVEEIDLRLVKILILLNFLFKDIK
jgi:hypothetical protein